MKGALAVVVAALTVTGGASLAYLAVGWNLSGRVGAIIDLPETEPVASANISPDQLPADNALLVRPFRVERAANLTLRYMPLPPRSSRTNCGVEGAIVGTGSDADGAGSMWGIGAGNMYGAYNRPRWEESTLSAEPGSHVQLLMGTHRGNGSQYEVFANLTAENPVLVPRTTEVYPRFWCGARYDNFNGTYHGDGYDSGVGRNMTWSVDTEQGTQALMRIYAAQPALRCRLEIHHNGSMKDVDATIYRRNGSSIEPAGRFQGCFVMWTGPPGHVELRIDEFAGQSTSLLYMVLDADPDRLPVVPTVLPLIR